jgi:hypothetical protein
MNEETGTRVGKNVTTIGKIWLQYSRRVVMRGLNLKIFPVAKVAAWISCTFAILCPCALAEALAQATEASATI